MRLLGQEHPLVLLMVPLTRAGLATGLSCLTKSFTCHFYAEAHGDVRGQLERGAEPIDPDFYARWLKSKGSLDEAEMCIRAHAAWREAFVTRGRIMEVLLGPLSISLSSLEKGCECDRFHHPAMPLEGCISCALQLEQTVCPSHAF